MTKKATQKSGSRTYLLVGQSYDDRIDIGTDVAIIFGHTGNFSHRAEKWREAGYRIHFMTGANYGSYDDYLTGKFDGKKHFNERQQKADGSRAERSPSVFYLVPSEAYIEYLKSVLTVAIDAGTEAIYLAEPEYSAETSYSTAFKSAWRKYYSEPWTDPWSSVDARYRSGKLKKSLLIRMLNEVFEYAGSYAQSNNRKLTCYITGHSLINYAHWGIVSPGAAMSEIRGCDGILAEVTTATARTPNIYNGIRRERTFETALMEYGFFANLAKSSNKNVIFSLDPVEDYQEHTWEDYKRNFEDTLVAALMYPEVFHYLVAPWPRRILQSLHSLESGLSDVKVPIPEGYATELLVLNYVLKNMKHDNISWKRGFPGIGILVSDTMMFQRGGPSSTEEDLSFFYGIALPLIKYGIIPQVKTFEQIASVRSLDDVRILLVSYSFMKPEDPQKHELLAEWIKSGRILIYIDDLKDPFNKINAWWNTGAHRYDSPVQHLFELLGLGTTPDFDDVYFVGRGRVFLKKANPCDFARSIRAGNELRTLIGDSVQFLKQGRRKFKLQNYLLLQRGPILIASVMDESVSLKPLRLRGKFIDLLNPDLAYHKRIERLPGERALLFNLAKIDRLIPRIIASASSIQLIENIPGCLTFQSSGPSGTRCITKIFVPKKPLLIEAFYNDQPYELRLNYERLKHVLTMRHENYPEGIRITVKYKIPHYPRIIQHLRNWLGKKRNLR
ncbi:hypothetical protein JXJ21_19210 [candidate division KSB1 bacterium]|nr:hypothetical protein [candidate division KSB1 bacterium]